jgi:TetR/AcrR family transcriptional repressor of nem operon
MARPKEFDKEKALHNTMLTFWKKGYDGTSISDILDATGISRSSLYETFGDKQTLFIEIMDTYRQFIGRGGLNIINDYLLKDNPEENSVIQVFRNYFSSRIDMALDTRYPGGCLITNLATSLETADDKVKNAVRAYIQKIEDTFRALLERGKETGELSPGTDTAAIASYLLGIASGINVLARVRKDRALLENIMNTALDNIT